MKLNGKIQIVGGNPGSNKVLTCTDNRGNCEWLEIPSSGDDDFVDSGSLVGNTLVLTTVDGNIVEVDLSNLSSSGRPGNDGVGVFSTVDNGDGTFTITYTDESFFTTSDLTGPQGPKGDTGTAGSPGADGKNGTNGVDGAKGDTGDIGPAGPKGDAGIQGIQGPKGDTGTAGSSGANGKNGTDGSDGVGVTSTVNNGDGTFTINYSDGSTFTSSDLTGPAGNDGNASDTFLTSATLQGNSLLLGLNTS